MAWTLGANGWEESAENTALVAMGSMVVRLPTVDPHVAGTMFVGTAGTGAPKPIQESVG